MQQLVNIFDLDHTLIDSSHRMNKFKDSSYDLDIDYWLENNTHENIIVLEVFQRWSNLQTDYQAIS